MTVASMAATWRSSSPQSWRSTSFHQPADAARTFLNNCLAPWPCGCALRKPSSAVKAPQSQYRCLSRPYVKWDLPWSDHVLSECKGTTQMAVSRRSGQRGKREEPIGPFSSSPSGSGERTLNVKTMLPTVTSQKIADVVQHRPGRSATRSPQAADAGLLDHDRQLPCRPASRRGRVGLSTSGFDRRLESRDGPRRWISR
jgi:hypothetical protein